MTFEEAMAAIPPGRYRHFKGNEYEVIGIARHSETEEAMGYYENRSKILHKNWKHKEAG